MFIVLVLKATLLLCVHFGLQVSEGTDEATQELHVHETTLGGEHRDVAAYRIDLLKALASKEGVTVTVETMFTHAIIPYPQEIAQVGVGGYGCVGGGVVSFPDDFSLSGGKIRLVICLFHFGSGALECWHIVLF